MRKVNGRHSQTTVWASRNYKSVGTPVYMAPEQWRGAEQIDGQVDVYALGVMLYEFVSGRPPFVPVDAAELLTMHMRDTPPDVQELVPELPADLCALIHAMLAKAAAERPTMAHVADELQQLEKASSAPPPPPPPPPGLFRYLLPALVVLLSLLIGWLLLRPR